MSKGNRIREWLGGLFRHVPCKGCDKMILICFKTDCAYNESFTGDYTCARKRVMIGRNAECMDYRKIATEAKDSD